MATDHRKVNTDSAQAILLDDPSFLRQIVEGVLQEVLEAEMAQHVGAAPYERTDARKGRRNGYKPRTLRTRVGTLNLSVPQDREGTFSTKLFCRYQRNEKALVLALMEMYLEGVSTRKVKDVTEELCGTSFSKRASSPRWPAVWTRSFGLGAAERWKRRAIPTSSWTPATRR
jgi:putative transposase